MENIKNTNLIPPSPEIDINTLKPFTRFCCSIGIIPASYLVAMSYEEQLLWLCDFLENTVIPTINNNGEAVTELQGLFIQLKTYVDNYFKNLDVQDEINNKLNEMAESGELQEIITAYLQVNGILAFNNIEEMKISTNLLNGSFAETYGFYEKNDGGNAKYKIREKINNEISDNITLIDLENGLVAELILEDTMSIKQFGAKGNGIQNDTLYIQKAVDNCKNVYFPITNDFYLVTDNINIRSNQKLFGDGEKSKIQMPNNLVKTIFNIKNVNDIIIDSLKLCNESCQTGSNPDLAKNKIIDTENVVDLTIKNCYFENAYSRGIYIFKTKNFNYINNKFKNATFDMLLLLQEVENVLVDNSIFDNITSSYINTYLFATGKVDNNIYDFSCKNIKVKNSKFLNNPNWEGIDTHACYGFYCENNYIENCKVGIMTQYGKTAPITSEEIKHGNIYIKNNIIKAPENPNFGIVSGVSADYDFMSKNIFIENNILDGFGKGSTIGAIQVIGNKYTNILNNNILNSKGSGIALTNIINANIKNNNIINVNSEYGIHFIAGCWFINITDNVIKNINNDNLLIGIRSGFRCIANIENNEIVANQRYSMQGTIMFGIINQNTTQIGKKGNFVKDEYGFIKYYCTDTVVRPAKTGTETNVSISGNSDTKVVTGNNALYHLTEGEEIIIPGAGLAGTDLTTVITEFVSKNTFKIKDTILLSFENVNPKTNAGTWIEI